MKTAAPDPRALHRRQLDVAASDAFYLGIALASEVLLDLPDGWQPPDPHVIAGQVTALLREAATEPADEIARLRARGAARRVLRANPIRSGA